MGNNVTTSTITGPAIHTTACPTESCGSSSRKRRSEPLIMLPISNTSKKNNSPNVSVRMVYQSGHEKTVNITPSRKKLCTQIARSFHSGAAKQCLSHPAIGQNVVSNLGRAIHQELLTLCSKKTASVLRDKSSEAILKFNWDDVEVEIQNHAPTLYRILRYCTVKRRNSHNDQQRQAIICLLISMMCKYRNPRMCLTQKILSLILYAGHASTQVYARLGKLMLTISDRSVISVLDMLGVNYDDKVHEWKDNLGTAIIESDEQITTSKSAIANYEFNNSVDKTVQPADHVILSDSSINSETDTNCNMSSDTVSSSSSDESMFPSDDEDILSDNTPAPRQCSALLDVQPQTTFQNELSQLKNAHELGSSTMLITDYCNVWTGFKIVGDNIDKHVKPRYMRVDSQSKSLHYFHLYAVKDRINLSNVPDTPRSIPDSIDPLSLLPCDEDYRVLYNHFTVLVSRCIVRHLPFFESVFSDVVQEHILHKYSNEMSKQSEVVPLGVILKNENILEEMISIMDHIHQYVPSQNTTHTVFNPITKQNIKATTFKFHNLLFGGDQLTVARARGAQTIEQNSTNDSERLLGLVPTIEDWHSKVVFLECIWRRLYSTNSSLDFGSMYQIRNLLNRRNISVNPSKNVNASEDFLLTIVHSHIIGMFMHELGMDTMDSSPSVLSNMSTVRDPEKKKHVLTSLCCSIVMKYVDLTVNASKEQFAHSYTSDFKNNYAREVVSLGLLYMEFVDSVREGDGERLLRCWRFLLPIFKASQRHNYALEALNFLTQVKYVLSPRLVEQLIWDRFVNTQGKEGKNISLDLHMEHLNATLKNGITGLGSNKTDVAICRLGKCIGHIKSLLDKYDSQHNVMQRSGKHSQTSFHNDLCKVVTVLTNEKVFSDLPESQRKHRTAFKISSPLPSNTPDDFVSWMALNMHRSFTFS